MPAAASAAVAAGSRLPLDAAVPTGMGSMSGKRKLRRLSSTTLVITSNRMISAASTDQYRPEEAPDLKRPIRQHLFTIYCMLSGSNTVHPSLYFCTRVSCIGVYEIRT
uniref:Secreted protein n=1 Tax=Mesocestoides corti TaxID=53468 RepID=A0A5K3G4W6_MESCO